jgi:hypothetical protein
MAIFEIPTRVDVANYRYSIILEEKTYIFEFKFNGRSQLWSMSIHDEENNFLVTDIMLFHNVDLIARYKNENLPPGRFIVFDTENESKNPGRNDLGLRVKLLYKEFNNA